MMTQDDIVRMSQEAGPLVSTPFDVWRDRFAALVAAEFAALVAAEKDKEIQKLREELAVTNKALDAAIDFAGTVGGSSSWWEEVWPEHEAAIDASR